jgi:hypothetical protein
MAQTMAGVTCSLRLPTGQIHSNMKKVSINLTPYPRMHFFVASLWPWNNLKVDSYSQLIQNVHKLVENRVTGDGKNEFVQSYTLFRGSKET